MSYRVETASSGRAVCKATECKTAGIKIEKDELRLGSWVAFEDRGSWAWKHWGCVTGFQIQNLRTYLEDPDQPGTYRWDFLDGYNGDEKNSLDKHPDLQEKVRRVITQGFIDEEDWNGDPEMNKLGEKGLRTKETKKRLADEKKKSTHEINELKAKNEAMEAEVKSSRQSGGSTSKLDATTEMLENQSEQKESVAKKKPAPKKRSRVKEESEDEEAFEEAKPAKKKRATKGKMEGNTDKAEVKQKPAKKSRAKKSVKPEDDDVDEEEEVMPAPSKRSRNKNGAKKKDDDDMVKEEHDPDVPVAAAPQKRNPRGKKAVKEEATGEENDLHGAEPVEKKQLAKRGRKKAVKEELSDDAAGIESSNPGITETSTENSAFKADPEPSAVGKGEPTDAAASQQPKKVSRPKKNKQTAAKN